MYRKAKAGSTRRTTRTNTGALPGRDPHSGVGATSSSASKNSRRSRHSEGSGGGSTSHATAAASGSSHPWPPDYTAGGDHAPFYAVAEHWPSASVHAATSASSEMAAHYTTAVTPTHGGKSGGGSSRRKNSPGIVRHWVRVLRAPAAGIGFQIPQWVTVEQLTVAERLKYETARAAQHPRLTTMDSSMTPATMPPRSLPSSAPSSSATGTPDHGADGHPSCANDPTVAGVDATHHTNGTTATMNAGTGPHSQIEVSFEGRTTQTSSASDVPLVVTSDLDRTPSSRGTKKASTGDSLSTDHDHDVRRDDSHRNHHNTTALAEESWRSVPQPYPAREAPGRDSSRVEPAPTETRTNVTTSTIFSSALDHASHHHIASHFPADAAFPALDDALATMMPMETTDLNLEWEDASRPPSRPTAGNNPDLDESYSEHNAKRAKTDL